MKRYTNWLYYGAGIFVGYWDAIAHSAELQVWQGAIYAVATVLGLWIIIFIFTGLKKEDKP